MNGIEFLEHVKGRKGGEWMLTDGTGLYVSGPLAVRWVKSFPKDQRRAISIAWESLGDTQHSLLILRRGSSWLRLHHQTGPTPKSGAKGHGTKVGKARDKAWRRNVSKYERDALTLPS